MYSKATSSNLLEGLLVVLTVTSFVIYLLFADTKLRGHYRDIKYSVIKFILQCIVGNKYLKLVYYVLIAVYGIKELTTVYLL